jgi:hypothetical protein
MISLQAIFKICNDKLKLKSQLEPIEIIKGKAQAKDLA